MAARLRRRTLSHASLLSLRSRIPASPAPRRLQHVQRRLRVRLWLRLRFRGRTVPGRRRRLRRTGSSVVPRRHVARGHLLLPRPGRRLRPARADDLLRGVRRRATLLPWHPAGPVPAGGRQPPTRRSRRILPCRLHDDVSRVRPRRRVLLHVQRRLVELHVLRRLAASRKRRKVHRVVKGGVLYDRGSCSSRWRGQSSEPSAGSGARCRPVAWGVRSNP